MLRLGSCKSLAYRLPVSVKQCWVWPPTSTHALYPQRHLWRLSAQARDDERSMEDRQRKEIPEQRMYGYAKKLQKKNERKSGPFGYPEEEFDDRASIGHKLKPEQSLLTLDLVRKHKASSKDARKFRMFAKEFPHKADHLINYRHLPFSHNDPASIKVNRAVIDLLRQPDNDEEDSEDEKQPVADEQLIRVPNEARESVGSLEYLQLRYGTPRIRRAKSRTTLYAMPLSRPDTRAFVKVQPETMSQIDPHFAEWFVGITEAQQAFHIMPDGRPYFGIYHNDMNFFRRVRSFLHFGHVDEIKQVFYIKADKNIQQIIQLLNGNLFLEKSRKNFSQWVEKYRELGTWEEGKRFEIKNSCGWKPQLNNKWLTGFIDASFGMFAGRIIEDSLYPFFCINLKFWIISEDREFLSFIQKMFEGGDIEQEGELWRWTIKTRKDHYVLDRYCRIFPPMSLKNISYCRYNRLFNYPLTKIKTNKAWNKVNRLVVNLNKLERQLALGLHDHPYQHRYKKLIQKQMNMAREGESRENVSEYKVEQEKVDFPYWDAPPQFKLIEQNN